VFYTVILIIFEKFIRVAPRLLFPYGNRKSENMLTKKEKVRVVFKGLVETDYKILQFFAENGPTTTYQAKVFFESSRAKKIGTQIPRSTLYNRTKILKEKRFLKVERKEKFKSGSLVEDMDILSTETPKSYLALVGTDADFFKILEPPRSEEGRQVVKDWSAERLLDFYSKILDSLVELKVDLTDLKGGHNYIMEFYYTALVSRRPEYVKKIMSQYRFPNGMKKTIETFEKLVEALRKEL
jgi:hypothetical protein